MILSNSPSPIVSSFQPLKGITIDLILSKAQIQCVAVKETLLHLDKSIEDINM